MPLINTDGLTIFGDGSQWFWSMLAFLAVPITGYVIYSQLRLARSIRAREQVEGLDREWDSERMMRYRLELLRAIRDGADPAHLPPGALAGIAVFWDRIGELVHRGHLDARPFHQRYSRVCQQWWAALETSVRRSRAALYGPTFYRDFEWLATRMAELDRAQGLAFDHRDPGELIDSIEILEGQIRVEEALRSVSAPRSSDSPQPGAPIAGAAPVTAMVRVEDATADTTLVRS